MPIVLPSSSAGESTARQIIQGALTFRLNRLSPGEAIDADVAAVCLDGLNQIVDELNGVKSFLFREITTQSVAITGSSALLGIDWVGLSSGDEILGATVQYLGGMDIPLSPITMGQYSDIPIKTTASLPNVYAHDGADTVYFYPACTGQTVTLRTRQIVSDFESLDAIYVMPRGYKSGLTDLLAERLAPSMLGGIPPAIASAAGSARNRLSAQASNPAIIGRRNQRFNILAGR